MGEVFLTSKPHLSTLNLKSFDHGICTIWNDLAQTLADLSLWLSPPPNSVSLTRHVLPGLAWRPALGRSGRVASIASLWYLGTLSQDSQVRRRVALSSVNPEFRWGCSVSVWTHIPQFIPCWILCFSVTQIGEKQEDNKLMARKLKSGNYHLVTRVRGTLFPPFLLPIPLTDQTWKQILCHLGIRGNFPLNSLPGMFLSSSLPDACTLSTHFPPPGLCPCHPSTCTWSSPLSPLPSRPWAE
jgi:hypothetical protein